MEEKDPVLPEFRKDLRMYQGPPEPDGFPTYSLYDPVRAKYYKVNWVESLLIQHSAPGLTAKKLADRINRKTTVRISTEEVEYFYLDAKKNNLLAIPVNSEEVIQKWEKKKQNPLLSILFHYLYFRVPVVSPNRFLRKTLPLVKPLVSPPALWLYLIVSLIGITLTLTRFDAFLHSFSYFFNMKGIFVYAATLTCIKFIHEFAHAYTAANFGVKVPSMGVAFIVMWPVLYTNITDSWKLVNRRHRFYISVAGVAAELIIAGIATFLWAFSSEGVLRSLWFVLASISWISSLLVNINPAMRFDGYYLLSDLWGVDNLQSVSFLVTRWKLREWLLGIPYPDSIRTVSNKRMAGFVAYSIFTWIYRIGLYTTIALFVYYKFTKVVGVLLFFIEIGVFMVWPIVSEIREILSLKKQIHWNRRLIASVAVFGILVLALILPYPHTYSFPALTVPGESQTLYAVRGGVLESFPLARNQKVQKGQTLYSIHSEELQTEITKVEIERNILLRELHSWEMNQEKRPFIAEKKAALSSAEAKLRTLLEKKNELSETSLYNGYVYDIDPTLREGQFVAKRQILAKITDPTETIVLFYIPEDRLHRIKQSSKASFYLYSNHKSIPGKILSISPVREIQLQAPQLASIHQGDLPVSEDSSGKQVLVESYYPAYLQLSSGAESLKYDQIGSVEVRGPWRSPIADLLNSLIAIFWRESGT